MSKVTVAEKGMCVFIKVSLLYYKKLSIDLLSIHFPNRCMSPEKQETVFRRWALAFCSFVLHGFRGFLSFPFSWDLPTCSAGRSAGVISSQSSFSHNFRSEGKLRIQYTVKNGGWTVCSRYVKCNIPLNTLRREKKTSYSAQSLLTEMTGHPEFMLCSYKCMHALSTWLLHS